MTDFQIYLSIGVFATVIVLIAFDVIDLALAAMAGVVVLVVFGVLTPDDMIPVQKISGGTLSLLFGGMVVARVLAGTGIFERIGALYLRASQGNGKRFLIGLVLLVAPICALLPNATTVVLLAPIIIRVARALNIDFRACMIIVAILSNSAGLLTLVGDPATFLVGSSVGISFSEYLRTVSLGGFLAVISVIPLMRFLMPDIWKLRTETFETIELPPLKNMGFAVFSLLVLAVMVILFVFGEQLPSPLVPPAVAIIGATFALIVLYSFKIESVDSILRDIDWKTIIFLLAIFCLVQGISKTGMIQLLSLKMHAWFGSNTIAVSLVMLFGVAVLSSVLANTPVVAAFLIAVKGYLVSAELVPEMALADGFSEWPSFVLPVFIAMMFGGTLGGNATLIGGAANIVAAGICAKQGSPISFGLFLKYGVPITAFQLAISALYVLTMSFLQR